MLKIYRRRTLIAMAILATGAVSIAAADHGGSSSGSSGKGNDSSAVTRHRAKLTGAAIQGKRPEGSASFRSQTSRQQLNVEVEDVNLPAATVLTVTLTHSGSVSTIGQITLNNLGEGELDLESQDGDVVPAVATGDVVTVMNGSAAVVTGVFN